MTKELEQKMKECDLTHGTDLFKTYLNFAMYQGEPESVLCEVMWFDTKEKFDVEIELSTINDSEEYEDDDEIFFYVEGIEGLIELCDWKNGEDFVVTKIYGFNK